MRRRPLILSALLLGVAGVLLVPAVAQAQVSIDPTNIPTKFTGGWVYAMAIGMMALGALIAVMAVVSYMRFAPRFARADDHGAPHAGARAEPIVEGREPPRRPVEVREVAPVLVPPPVVAAAEPAAAPAAASAATPAVPAKAAATPATAAPAAKPAAPAEAKPAASTTAPAPAEPKPEEATAAQPAEAKPAEEPKPAAEAPAQPAAEPPAQPAADAPAQPAAVHSGPAELDQETFEGVLAEQLGKGVDRRVAEGRARSAAVVAARKKAGG